MRCSPELQRQPDNRLDSGWIPFVNWFMGPWRCGGVSADVRCQLAYCDGEFAVQRGCYNELEGRGDELAAPGPSSVGVARGTAMSNGSAAEGSYAPLSCPHGAAAIFTLWELAKGGEYVIQVRDEWL